MAATCYPCCLRFPVIPPYQLTLFLQGQLALRRLTKEQQCEAEDPDKLYKEELSDDEGKKPKGKGRGRGRGRGKAKAKQVKSTTPPAETKVDNADSTEGHGNSKDDAAQQEVEGNQHGTTNDPVPTPTKTKKTAKLKRAATSAMASSPRDLRRTKSRRLNLLRSVSKSPNKRLLQEVQPVERGDSQQEPSKAEHEAVTDTAPKKKKQKKCKTSTSAKQQHEPETGGDQKGKPKSEEVPEPAGSSESIQVPKPAKPGPSDPAHGDPDKKGKDAKVDKLGKDDKVDKLGKDDKVLYFNEMFSAFGTVWHCTNQVANGKLESKY